MLYTLFPHFHDPFSSYLPKNSKIETCVNVLLMLNQKLNLRKKIGFILLAMVGVYWIAFPIVPFLDIPHKALVMTTMAIGGEILLLIVIALLGKEYWDRIKTGFKRLFSSFKSHKKKSDDLN